MKLIFIYKYFNNKERHSGMSNLIKELKEYLDKKTNLLIFSANKPQDNIKKNINLKKPFMVRTAIRSKKEKGNIIVIFNTIDNSLKAFFYYLIIRIFNINKKIILYQGTPLKTKIFNKLFLSMFNKVFCVSPLIYNNLKAIINKKAIYIPPGVNFEKLEKIRAIPKNKKIRIGFFGHLDKHKGPELLLKSFIKLNIKNMELILAGKGRLKNYLEKKSKNIKNIKIYGYLKNNKEYIKSCDIIILPFKTSKYILGLSLTGIEGKAMGKVLIGTKTPSISQIIEDNEDGFIIKNYKELSEKIQLLYKDKYLLKKMSKKAKINSKEYDINKTGEKFLKECNNCLIKDINHERTIL